MPMAGFATCVTVSATAAIASGLLLGRIWSACDVGISSANSMALLFLYIPAIFVVAAAITSLVYLSVQLLSGSRMVAGASTVVAAVAVFWIVQVLFHFGDYPSPTCPDNLPPWWPGWIPL